MNSLLLSQRVNPLDSELEEKLIIVLHNLGSKHIPSLPLDPFYEDFTKEPDLGCQDRELWEDQLGIKLAVSLTHHAVTKMAEELQNCRLREETLKAVNSQLDMDKEKLLQQNQDLVNELKKEKQTSAAEQKRSSVLSRNSKRQKGLPQIPLVSPPLTPGQTPRNLNLTVDLFHGDPSFVPETMELESSPNKNPFETQQVLESPEKLECSFVTREGDTMSPVIVKKDRLKLKKMFEGENEFLV